MKKYVYINEKKYIDQWRNTSINEENILINEKKNIYISMKKYIDQWKNISINEKNILSNEKNILFNEIDISINEKIYRSTKKYPSMKKYID